jgi:hypothetical protein
MGFRRTICATSVTFGGASAGVPSEAAGVQPRISSASVGEVGHNLGADYFVTVTARARVCAAIGRLTLRVGERKILAARWSRSTSGTTE